MNRGDDLPDVGGAHADLNAAGRAPPCGGGLTARGMHDVPPRSGRGHDLLHSASPVRAHVAGVGVVHARCGIRESVSHRLRQSSASDSGDAASQLTHEARARQQAPHVLPQAGRRAVESSRGVHHDERPGAPFELPECGEHGPCIRSRCETRREFCEQGSAQGAECAHEDECFRDHARRACVPDRCESASIGCVDNEENGFLSSISKSTQCGLE